MAKPTPTEAWAAGVCIFVAGNGTLWRKGTDATLCAALIRPVITALGAAGPPATWGALIIFGHHLLKPIPRGHRRLSLRKEL